MALSDCAQAGRRTAICKARIADRARREVQHQSTSVRSTFAPGTCRRADCVVGNADSERISLDSGDSAMTDDMDDAKIVTLSPRAAKKAWHSMCVLNPKGKIIPNHANAMKALRYDPD